MSKAVHIFAEH